MTPLTLQTNFAIFSLINSLKLKTSCGHDNVYTLLLKQIQFAISLTLSIAVNKST